MATEKQLFVLRHAKSSWEDAALDDHDRPLAPRGIRDAELMREHVRGAGVRPELVLCSSARRTRETLAAVSPGGAAMIEPELYDASRLDVIARLARVPEEIASVMVVGHNPTMHLLVRWLVEAAGAERAAVVEGIVDSPLAVVRSKFPTGALATLRLECGWSDLRPGCAQLTAFVRPKALR